MWGPQSQLITFPGCLATTSYNKEIWQVDHRQNLVSISYNLNFLIITSLFNIMYQYLPLWTRTTSIFFNAGSICRIICKIFETIAFGWARCSIESKILTFRTRTFRFLFVASSCLFVVISFPRVFAVTTRTIFIPVKIKKFSCCKITLMNEWALT